MKIQILSDLHMEFGSTPHSFDQADLVILAGDTNQGKKGIEWVKNTIKDKPVIYLLGNHEYYRGSYPKTLHQIREAAEGTNIHVLENESVDIDGIRFHGATLWTDFCLIGNDPLYYGALCQDRMNDYRMIKKDPSFAKLRSVDTYNIHKESRRWLEQSLRESTASVNFVITHHAPSIKSVPDHYENDPITAAYASNLEDLMEQYQPRYWVHGHIHTPVRYHIGATEVICNPHGYIDEEYNGFDPGLIVEIIA